jgi:ACS family sodium-dependent inorganic phosphate cotransporter
MKCVYKRVFRHQSASEWQIVFYIASGLYLLGAVVYGLCASGELQSWAVQEDGNDNKEEHCYANRAVETDTV